jgi:hypothetical protein
VGMVEGVVPTAEGVNQGPEEQQTARQAVAGNAAFVYSSEIAKLVVDANRAWA